LPKLSPPPQPPPSLPSPDLLPALTGGMWLDDGSGAVQPAADAPEFTIDGKAKGDAPVNARFSTCLTSGQYFEVDILELSSSCFLGVTTEASFKQGYYCKGLFFGGNLSTGSALVRQAFGERFEKGMKIGVLTEFEGSTITVTFYQDGRCLGPAFVSKRLTDKEVFPVVQASSDGDRFAIRFLESAPAVRTREPKGGGVAHPAEGNWALQRLNVGPELGEFPLASKMEGEEVTLKVEADKPGSFHLSARVCNHLRMVTSSQPDESLAPFDKITPGPVMSTMMMGPEGMMEVESAISTGLESVHKWLAKDGTLLLVGPAVEMSFVPKVDGEEGLPATEVELP